jgi:long-chain acyl-CoA synthetase
MIKDKEKHLLPWYPEKLDWYDYWLNVHFPGMRKWVLPTLEEELKIQEKRSYTYKDLLDLFDTSVKRFRHASRCASSATDGRSSTHSKTFAN